MGRIDYSAVSQDRKRLQQKLKADRKMYTLFREIEGIFNSKKSNVEICPPIFYVLYICKVIAVQIN